MHEPISDTSPEPLKAVLKKCCVVIVFGIAFAYVEAAVVVYLRAIFHPSGFTFPMPAFGIGSLWKRLLLTEVGREAATIVLIFTSSWLFGRNLRQRLAFFLTIFAVWDIFYYIWLKLLLDWPASIMDWDILFLIPTVWAGPVIAPVMVSLLMLAFAIAMLFCSAIPKPTPIDRFVFILAALLVVISFSIAGLHITETGFESHFNWWLFAAGLLSTVVLFVKYLLKCK